MTFTFSANGTDIQYTPLSDRVPVWGNAGGHPNWHPDGEKHITMHESRRRGQALLPVPVRWFDHEDPLSKNHDLLTEFALEFIHENKNRPFFLYVPYCIPHAKLEVPDLECYADKDWPEDAKIFAAMITRMDRDVGRILDLADELGIGGKTIVFFCSDNGSARGWQGLFDSCGPLREKKGSVYDGGIRTPMVVRWPGNVPASKTSEAVWYFADFLPTAAQLAGVRPPENIDGIGVPEALHAAKPPKKLARKLRDRFLYWEAASKKGFRQAVRHGDWKAVRHGQGKTLELYDLSKDVGETNDVAAQNPEVVKKIEKYLKTCRTDSIHWPLSDPRG